MARVFSRGRPELGEKPLDLAPAALFELDLGQVVEVALEAPALALGLLGDALEVAEETGQLERPQEDPDALGAGAHRAPAWAERGSSTS